MSITANRPDSGLLTAIETPSQEKDFRSSKYRDSDSELICSAKMRWNWLLKNGLFQMVFSIKLYLLFQSRFADNYLALDSPEDNDTFFQAQLIYHVLLTVINNV